MKRIAGYALLLLALACAASHARAQGGPPPPAPAVEYDANAWKEFSSEEGKFSVRMPAEPKLNRMDVETPLGKLPAYVYVAQTGTGGYMVGYSDFPNYSETPEFAAAVFKGARDKVMSADAARRLLSETEIKLEGYAGREWLIADARMLYRARTFLVKGRLYQLLFLAPNLLAFNSGHPSENASDRTGLYEEISKRFFGSFGLLHSGASEPPPKPAGGVPPGRL
ncbi:MAG TPA: hypothetical protein VGP08_19730 [Pyrinomonadaceae bacterium]|nr:hypothetical protein [Pyrinomonadaceae bacterium]